VLDGIMAAFSRTWVPGELQRPPCFGR